METSSSMWMRCSRSSFFFFFKICVKVVKRLSEGQRSIVPGHLSRTHVQKPLWDGLRRKLKVKVLQSQRKSRRRRVPMFSLGQLGLYFSEPQFPLCQASESRDSALALKPRHPEDGPSWGIQLDSRLSSTKLCDWLVGERRDTKKYSGEKGYKSPKKSLLRLREEMDRLPCAKL